MNNELFESLLYEEESTTLDFKKEQYRFVKATDNEKSELLKDILGFANAWRRSEAYILIGVEDVRGGRSDIVGIPATDHLDDHSLQQFVNNLTNQPVRFHYEAFGFEGKQVGIIRVDGEQTRPIYLKKNYGKLLKGEVYIRRGSSTDPTKPASPEEIAQMRVGADQTAAAKRALITAKDQAKSDRVEVTGGLWLRYGPIVSPGQRDQPWHPPGPISIRRMGEYWFELCVPNAKRESCRRTGYAVGCPSDKRATRNPPSPACLSMGDADSPHL
jgi:hypothetical protein